MASNNITINDEKTLGHSDSEGAKIGMWLFLFTELLLFGGLFILFSSYFNQYSEDFHIAGRILNRTLGTANTVVLITSSFLIALSVSFISQGKVALSRYCMLGTVLLALVFLCIKYVEWSTKIHHGIYPNGPVYETFPLGQMTFFNLYYFMTGLHAIHVIIGGTLILWIWHRTNKQLVTPNRYIALENVALYWHLVDLVWIYLFPLFYLAM